MEARYERFVRLRLTSEESAELVEVDGLAHQLKAHLERSRDDITKVHVHGAGNAREQPYKLVVHRMAAFFGHPRREVDVVSAHVLGYGN